MSKIKLYKLINEGVYVAQIISNRVIENVNVNGRLINRCEICFEIYEDVIISGSFFYNTNGLTPDDKLYKMIIPFMDNVKGEIEIDLDKLIEYCCYIKVVHNESANGVKYANVKAFKPQYENEMDNNDASSQDCDTSNDIESEDENYVS